MSATKITRKKQGKEPESVRSAKKARGDETFDPDLSNDIKGIISALQQIKEKAQQEGQKKSEEAIASAAAEVKSMLDDAKSKIEKERQIFEKALSKSSKENEYTKFQAFHEKFSKERAAHLQAFKVIFSKFEDEKQKLVVRYQHQRKKEKATLSELEKATANKIAAAEELLKKKKQDSKSFSILRKSLGSLLDCGSDEDFPPDDD